MSPTSGAKVLASIPLGPVARTVANLTTISQNGSLDLRLLVDPMAITDPPGLRRNIDEANREWAAAGGIVI